MKKLIPKFNIFLSTFLLLSISLSIVTVVNAVTPNPGHPFTEVGDGIFSVTGPTSLRTYTFPDSDATMATLQSSPAFTGTVTTGAVGGTTGSILFKGTTSGTVTLKTADVAGTYTLILPTDDGIPSQFLQTDGSGVLTWTTIGGGGDALVASPLSQFAATTSLQLKGVISNETGSGALVFADSPALTTPDIGTPSAGVATNLSGTAASLTAGNVTTNANLTGHITSVGNAAVLGSFSIAQLNTAVSDADAATLAGTETLSGKTLTAPKFVDLGFIADANGNEILILDTVASAVNELTLANAAATGVVTLTVTGGDTDVALSIDAKGADPLNLNGTATGDLVMGGGSGSTGCTLTNASGAFACAGAVTGSNLSGANTGDNAANSSSTFIGTTSVALNRASAALTLAGITLTTPDIGTPSAGVATNLSGTAASLTAGNVTTNANLTGHITSVGNAAVLGSFSIAQLNTAVSDADAATLAGTETLSGKTLTAPKFVDLGFIADANGNEILILDTVDTAVPYLQLSNNTTGLNPVLTGAGETNTGIDFLASGTGAFRFLGNVTQAGEIRLFEDTTDGTNYSAFKVGIQSADLTYTLPTAYAAVTGYVLASTDAGVLSWAAAGGSSTWNGVTNPTGSQTLTFDDAELNAWTVSSDTETFHTITANSLTTGKIFSIASSSLTSGTFIDLAITGTGGLTNQKGLNISLSGANGTGAQTTYGAYLSNTHTGTSTNVGLYATASGGTNNYGLIVDSGSVGIGLTAPLLKLDVAGSSRFTGAATSVLTGSINAIASQVVTGVNTLFTTELVVGDRITVTGETRTVIAIASNTSLTVDTATTDTADDTSPDKLAAIFVARDSSSEVQMVINDAGLTSINNLETGPLNFDTDAGAVSWADMPVSCAAAACAGTVESYTANLNGSSVLTIYGTAVGAAGGVQSLGVGIGTLTPTSLLHVIGFQPASVATTPATAAQTGLTATGGIGGDTTIATTGVGGVGGPLVLTGGVGGLANSATTADTGGAGGALTFTTGAGGAAGATGGIKIGGVGGTFVLSGGTGGATTGTGTSNTGGAGADIYIVGGAGGTASGATSNTAGASGDVLLAITSGGTATGNVGIGITAPTNILHVTGAPAEGVPTARIANTLAGTTQNNGLLILAGNDTGVNAPEMITFQRPDTTVIGSISQNAATTVAFNTSSDRRIKENITPTAFGLPDLLKINVSDFTFISDPNKQKMTGFVAQDLNDIFPGAVTANGDDGIEELIFGKTPWMIDYSKLTPLIVKSVQDLNLNLEGIAGVIAPLADSANESFVTAFFTNLYAKVAAWMADAANSIGDFFANRVRTKELCVSDDSGETCITRGQLNSLLTEASVSPAPAPAPEPEQEVTPEPEPQPVAEVPEPEVSPEPDSLDTPVEPEVGTLTESVGVEPEILPESTPEPESQPEADQLSAETSID